MLHTAGACGALVLLNLVLLASGDPPVGQHPLGDAVTEKKSTSLPITSALFGWFNTINMTVGSPPQTFRTVLDLGWTDFLLPSTDCDNQYHTGFCGDASNLYNSSASSTNQVDHGPNSALEIVHYMLRWFGTRNRDVLGVGDVQLDTVDFLSADHVNAMGFLALYHYDAVLGLPRYPAACERGERWSPVCGPGPFHKMINAGLLERHLFSLRLPEISMLGDDSGTFDLGFVNQSMYTGELLTLPISDIPKDVEDSLGSAWHVDFVELSFGSVIYAPKNYHAVFSTIEPFIWLPEDIWQAVAAAIFVDEDERRHNPFLRTNCSRRSEMPDFNFVLGPESTVITLTPDQYAIKTDEQADDGSFICISLFAVPDTNESPSWGDSGAIQLGSFFLKNFYSVFDVDNDSISCRSNAIEALSQLTAF